MTDSEFTALIAKTASAYNKYRKLIEKAEAEYVRRYGKHPSDIDDDFWIDSLQGGGGAASAITAAEVDQHTPAK